MKAFARPRLVCAARYAAYAVVALFALGVAAALVLPAFLDTQRVAAELQANLSHAVQGEVAWEKLDGGQAVRAAAAVACQRARSLSASASSSVPKNTE